MKRKTFVLTFVLVVLVSSGVGLMHVEIATANNPGSWFPQEHYPTITITRDGNITPQTDLISKNGNTYTLTTNITTNRVSIDRSNIVFDGNGYTINLWNETYPAIFVGFDQEVINVTIKDIEVVAYSETIRLSRSSYCQIINVTSNSNIQLGAMGDYNSISQCRGRIVIGMDSKHNLVFRNNITGILVYGYTDSSIFYKNNFLTNYRTVGTNPGECSWDNGQVGNYWIDYNGTDANGDGIGDTPYIINSGNIDHYPLMHPYDIEKDAITLPTPVPPIESETKPLPTTLIAGVSTALILGILIAVILLSKKKSQTENYI